MVEITTDWDRPCRSLSGAATRFLAVRLRPSPTSEASPIHALVLLDISTSMADGGRMPAAISAIRTAWQQLRPGDRLAIVTFGSHAHRLLSWTTRGESPNSVIAEALAAIDIGGTTCLETGLAYGLRMLGDCPAGDPRYLWLVTDGNPTDPKGRGRDDYTPYLDEASRAASDGLTVCALGLGDAANYNAPFLRDLADRGRGQFCYAPDPAGLAAHVSALLAAAGTISLSQARLDLSLRPGNLVKSISRILPEYLPMDVPGDPDACQVMIGAIVRPETVILVELTNVALLGTCQGEAAVGTVVISGRSGTAEFISEAVAVSLEFAPSNDPRLHHVNPETEDLRVSLEIARNTEMRSRSRNQPEKLAITSRLVDLSRLTGNIRLISTYEAELAQLTDDRMLTADQETQAVAQARTTGRLLQSQ